MTEKLYVIHVDYFYRTANGGDESDGSKEYAALTIDDARDCVRMMALEEWYRAWREHEIHVFEYLRVYYSNYDPDDLIDRWEDGPNFLVTRDDEDWIEITTDDYEHTTEIWIEEIKPYHIERKPV